MDRQQGQRAARGGVPLRAVLAASLLLWGVCGCSLGVMTGKMLTGDPLLPAAFTKLTGVDLTEGEHSILVICSTPEYVHSEHSSLKLDLTDGIARRMKANGVNVVNPDDVATWMDDHGGLWDGPSEIAGDFDADFVAVIDVQEYGYREPSSPDLLRGSASGTITAYQVLEIGGEKVVQQVFVNEFTSTWPRHLPISQERQSEKIFRKQYLDRVSDQLAETFYAHRPLVGI